MHVRIARLTLCLAKVLLEKSELLDGMMQGTATPARRPCALEDRRTNVLCKDVKGDPGAIPLNNVTMNVLKKVRPFPAHVDPSVRFR